MANKLNKDKLREFFFRRRVNFATLLTITLMSIVATIICRLTGFIPGRLVLLEIVTLLLVILCGIQGYRMRRGFRTMKGFKGRRKKRKTEE